MAEDGFSRYRFAHRDRHDKTLFPPQNIFGYREESLFLPKTIFTPEDSKNFPGIGFIEENARV